MNWVFLKDLGERAVNTFVQSLIGVLAVGPAGLNVFTLDWKSALLAAGTATAVSVAKGLVAFYYTGSGSLVKPHAPAAPAAAPAAT
jgi:hypothetical protein